MPSYPQRRLAIVATVRYNTCMRDVDFKTAIGAEKKMTRSSLKRWKHEYLKSERVESPRDFYQRVTAFFTRIMPNY